MGKRIEKLTASQVRSAKPKPDGKPKTYPDGGGLYLRAIKGASGETVRAWFLKYTTPQVRNGRHYEPSLGLGSADTVTLAEAREAAREADKQRREAWRHWKPGDPRPANDPVEAKRLTKEARKTAVAAKKAEAVEVLTFDRAADQYVDRFSAGWRSRHHRKQWIESLRRHVSPHVGQKAVAEITRADVLAVLEPLWISIPETASRLRGRIEAILDFADREQDNPARRAVLKSKLPRRNRATVQHFSAVPHREIGKLIAELRADGSVVALSLEFLILTAVRRGELLGGGDGQVPPATWAEVDFDTRLWVIPRERTKRFKETRVPLSDRCIEILKRMRDIRCDDRLFPINVLAPWHLLRKMRPGRTLHGLRSSFRDFAGDETHFPREVIEAALAHTVGGVEGAYRRGDALEKRRQLMEAWAQYCDTSSHDKVVPLRVA